MQFHIEELGRALFAAAVVFLAAPLAEAGIDFSALQRDGYGMVEIKRPQPNVLTVLATIDGRKALLVLDTGWSGQGITVESEYMQLANPNGTSARPALRV